MGTINYLLKLTLKTCFYGCRSQNVEKLSAWQVICCWNSSKQATETPEIFQGSNNHKRIKKTKSDIKFLTNREPTVATLLFCGYRQNLKLSLLYFSDMSPDASCRTKQSPYPVCLEDGVQAEEGHHSKQQPEQRRLERGLEV